MRNPELLYRDWHAQESARAGVRFPQGAPHILYGSCCLMFEKKLHRQAGLGTIGASKTSELHFPCLVKISISGSFRLLLSGCVESVALPYLNHYPHIKHHLGFNSVTLKIPSSSVLCLKETPQMCSCAHANKLTCGSFYARFNPVVAQ